MFDRMYSLKMNSQIELHAPKSVDLSSTICEGRTNATTSTKIRYFNQILYKSLTKRKNQINRNENCRPLDQQ